MLQTDNSHTSKTLSRRSAIALVSAIAAGSTVGALSADPVFAAIEAYHCACKRVSAAVAASDDGPDDETDQDHINATRGLVTTMPTTTAGLVALLKLLGRNEWVHEEIAGNSNDDSVYQGALYDAPDEAFTFFERLADHLKSVPLTGA